MFVATDCRRGRPRKSATPADSGLAVAVADVEAVTVTPNVLAASSAVRPRLEETATKFSSSSTFKRRARIPTPAWQHTRANCRNRLPELRVVAGSRVCEELANKDLG